MRYGKSGKLLPNFCCEQAVATPSAEVGGRIPTTDFRYKKLKILTFMVTNVGKDGTFPPYSCFSTMDSFRFEEIVSANGAFQEI